MKLTFALTAILLALSACASNQTNAPAYQPAVAPQSATVSHAIQGRETATGTFVGQEGHVTSGHASVFLANGQWYVSLANDFAFDGAPDPKVSFGSNGFKQDAILAPLQSNAGASVYAVPARLDVGNYNEIWIWCEQFGVPLGVAKLTLT